MSWTGRSNERSPAPSMPAPQAAGDPRAARGNSRSVAGWRWPAVVVLLAGLCHAAEAWGAKPYIWYVYPAGGQQGTTVEVLVQGKDLQQAEAAYVSGARV